MYSNSYNNHHHQNNTDGNTRTIMVFIRIVIIVRAILVVVKIIDCNMNMKHSTNSDNNKKLYNHSPSGFLLSSNV